MDLRGQHEEAAEVNEWIKFGMRIAVSIQRCDEVLEKCIGKFNFSYDFRSVQRYILLNMQRF